MPQTPNENAAPATRKPNPRHDQWTLEKMAAFLRELAATQSVSHAAKGVGMSRQSAYRLRNRLEGTPFALAWEVALEAGLQQLAHAVMDRALNGEEVPHYYHGELVGTTRRYDNRLASWLLDNPGKIGRHQLAREYASSDWDGLLERVEADGNRWDPEDIAGADELMTEGEREDMADPVKRAARASWYVHHAPSTEQRTAR